MKTEERPHLRQGRVHEIVASISGDAAGRIFAAGIAGRLGSSCLWIVGRRLPTLCPHGLHGLIDVNAVTLVHAQTPLEGLWVAEEALRSGVVRTVVVEEERPVDLLQSRRLQLAAEAGRAVGMILGPDSGNTAVETRWRCTAMPGAEEKQIRFDWEQVKNKKGSNIKVEAVRDEATGRMRVVAPSGGGTGVEEPARPGSTLRDRVGGGRRLEALLAEHGGASGGTDLRHVTG